MNTDIRLSVLVTHYRRAELLGPTLASISRATSGFQSEVILCDDGSGSKVLAELQDFSWDILCTVKRNAGLGANLNRGLRLFRGDWLLCVQDDWEFQAPPDFITRSIALMEAHPTVGMVRYYVPNFRELEKSSRRIDGPFGQAVIFEKPTTITHINRDIYSDTPSLRSRAFVDSMGLYLEGIGMAETENDYVNRFLAQSAYSVAMFADNGWNWARHTGEEASIRLPAGKKRMDSLLLPVRLLTRIFPLSTRLWLRTRYERIWERLIKAVR